MSDPEMPASRGDSPPSPPPVPKPASGASQQPAVRPNGEERLVALDELFFSTTDRRGVIRSGNSVFSRISGYPLEELVGSPHNVVRHPAMPAGAFRLLWDRLLAGRPAAAYVQNLARDGRAYWVLATITPLGEGFLSVRMAPRSSLFEAARRLYPIALAAEERAREAGATRITAAATGAIELEGLVRSQGFDSYEHFVMEALPAEVAARERLAGSFARSGATGAAAHVSRAAIELDGQIGALVAELDAYRDLSLAMTTASHSMLLAVDQLREAVSSAHAGAEVAGTSPALRSIADAMGRLAEGTVDMLRMLVGDLQAARSGVSALRFRIALARVQNDMVAGTAAEVIDGRAPSSALAEVPLLCDALHECVTGVADAIADVNRRLSEVAGEITSAGAQLADVRRFLGQWCTLGYRRGRGAELEPYVEPIERLLDAGRGQLEELDRLGEQCRARVVSLDESVFAGPLAIIRASATAASITLTEPTARPAVR